MSGAAPLGAEQLAWIRENSDRTCRTCDSPAHLRSLLAAYDAAAAEVERLRPMAAAHESCLRASAEREYADGGCDDCLCCTPQQCRESTCPTDSIGDSICPCTCD